MLPCMRHSRAGTPKREWGKRRMKTDTKENLKEKQIKAAGNVPWAGKVVCLSTKWAKRL